MKFISDVTFLSWPDKSVKPNFPPNQSYRNNNKFNCCLEIQSKTDARISICTLTLYNCLQIKFISNVTFPLWPGNSVNPHFSQYKSYKSNYKFTCCFKCHWKMAAIISICTIITLMKDRNHFLIWRHFPVVAR